MIPDHQSKYNITDPRMASTTAAPRQYEIFDPRTELVAEEGAVTFLVHLPEFRKEQLKVQLSSSRLLRISGERPVGDNKWKHFIKEIRVPEECDTKGIVAKFEGGILYVKQPKFVQPKILEPEPEPEPVPEPEPEPEPEPIDAPSSLPDEEKKEKPAAVVDQATTSLDAADDLGKKIKKEEIDPDELGRVKGRDDRVSDDKPGQVICRGGLFDKNLKKRLLLITLSIVALVFHLMYLGRVFKRL